MSPNPERHVQLDRARRNFLGLAAETSAKLAAVGALAATTIFPASIAQAMGKPWWKKEGGPGDPMCFLRGTAIATPTGETCIEDLKIGDLVETSRGKTVAVKWIGQHVYKRSGVSWNESVFPIRIARHAIDQRTPHKDLYVSPGHGLLIDGVLIRAKDLVNGVSIAPALPVDRKMIEYFHIVLDTHEAILAEGAAAETLLLADSNHEGFKNFAEFARLYPDWHGAMTPLARTVSVDSGREQLKALLPSRVRRMLKVRQPAREAHRRIAARAGQLIG